MPTFLDKVRNVQFNSGIARSLLSYAYHEGRDYRVPFGPLRGFRLQYDRGVNFHAILGLWELGTMRFLNSVLVRGGFLKPGMIVADVGANRGLFSLWASRILSKLGGKVFAFEPAPGTWEVLLKNLALNAITNVEPVSAACSNQNGSIDFFPCRDHHMSSLCADWAAFGGPTPEKVVVASTTLDHFFCESNRPVADFFKIDIEGGGCYALYGMDRCVEAKRPLIWIESHTPAEDKAIGDLLKRTGYQAYRFETRTMVKKPDQTHPDPDGVWGSLLLFPRDQQAKILGIV